MANKKKTSKKRKATRAVPSQPKLDSKPVSPPETEATLPAQAGLPWQPRPDALLWLTIVVLALLALGVFVNLRKNHVAPPPASSASSDTPSTLRVIGDEGSSSTGAADALQPQSTGLQQVPTVQQSNNGANLQAPTTPEITPQTLPD